MPVRIIGELGSCHMGRKEYAKEAIDLCAELGLEAIKFQLFPNTEDFTKVGNVWLDPELYSELVEYAHSKKLKIGASCFDEDSFTFLLKTKSDFIKFAYSQKHRDLWMKETILNDIEAIVSCDVMSEAKIPRSATKLFCLPHYPVYFQICFNELFPRFDGFSDHSLGFEQTLEAVFSGANVIEKHFTLSSARHQDITCPDSYFALKPFELSSMVAAIRKIERDGIL